MSEIESTNIDMLIGKVLGRFAYIRLAILFGSVAAKKAGIDSDIDIAVLAKNSLTASEKISIINALAEAFGRPVDLVDLHKVGEPLLGQILQHG
jgi:predicted nucleotidyltransferase